MANNGTSGPSPPPPPEDDNFIDSPPPPPSKTGSSPPPPPSKDTPSPPNSRAPPPPATKTTPPPPPPSKGIDNPPPRESPPPDAPSPPPPSPSKADSTSPPPPPPSTSPSPSSSSSSSPPPPDKINNNPPPPIVPNNTSPVVQSNNPPPKQSQFIPDPHDLPFVPPSRDDSPVSINAPVGSLPTWKISPPAPITSETTNSSSSNSSYSHIGVIAGISVGGVLILAFIIVCVLCCKRKKKQRPYYYDNERQANDQFYRGTSEWNTPHSSDHVVKLPPPGVVVNAGVAPQWGVTPSPHVNHSNEYHQGISDQHTPSLQPPSPMGGLGYSQCQFSYEDLATATSGFAQANLLGQGGFGYVHKGVLPDGKVVAVKSLKSGSGQGEREFQAEVEIISRVHHRHLVSLVGYCITDGQRMLVYEFVANQTMEHHLHGKGRPVMDWSSRVRIAIGSAKGLAYLHEDCHPRIIHRDIKAANILLDENYEAMVADFGLAKLTTDNFTHVSTRVMGTFGYLAPEYASSGKLTEKSDVFSFGVMLLELITGRRPVDLTGQTMEDSLADWARPLLGPALENENYEELADPRMEGNYVPHEMASMISCAAASTRHSAKRRPKMSQIFRALEGDSILMEETSEVSKSTPSKSNGSSSHDSAYDTVAYNADMMKFRNMVMNNQDVETTTSEYGATSEYGLNPSSSSSSNTSREMAPRTGQHIMKY